MASGTLYASPMEISSGSPSVGIHVFRAPSMEREQRAAAASEMRQTGRLVSITQVWSPVELLTEAENLRAGELSAATMQQCESIADPGITKELRSGGNERVEGGVRRKRRGGRKRGQ